MIENQSQHLFNKKRKKASLLSQEPKVFKDDSEKRGHDIQNYLKDQNRPQQRINSYSINSKSSNEWNDKDEFMLSEN